MSQGRDFLDEVVVVAVLVVEWCAVEAEGKDRGAERREDLAGASLSSLPTAPAIDADVRFSFLFWTNCNFGMIFSPHL